MTDAALDQGLRRMLALEGAAPASAEDAVDGVAPRAVMRPQSIEAARHAVRAVSEAGLAMLACGLRGHLAIGAPPERLDVVLRLDRLDRVLEHQAADMTVTVEAGCSLAALERTLGAAGQWLPIDPPAPDRTTVGGLVAANLSGPLRASQGTVRDLLLGLRWIAPDGTLVSGGGKVVKNVAGYDLPKLHVGALGTLGVIVSATFKVRPRPECERALLLGCASPEAAVRAALALRDAVEPAWLEIASAGVVAAEEAGPQVIVGLVGLAEEVEDATARVRARTGAGAHGSLVAADDAGGLRARLASFACADVPAVLRAATLADDVGRFLATAVAASRDAAGRAAPWVAHAASGVVRIALAAESSVAPVVRALRRDLAARGGSLVVERASAAAKRRLEGAGEVWGDPGDGLALMRGLKEAFDPGRALSPGRFVAGI